MQEEYIQEYKIIDKTEKEKDFELLSNIVKVREDLKNANKNFELADSELVDYYAYQIKAHQYKLDNLIKIAKAKGITQDMIHDMKMKLDIEKKNVVG